MTVAEDIHLARELPDGALIEFEERLTGYRAYWYTPPNGTRSRFPSVTTILGQIMPKYGLLDYYEAKGAEGALILCRGGFLDHVDPTFAVDAVREAGLGAKASAGEASKRGQRIHKVLETYCLTGEIPNPRELAPEDRGYLRGLVRWILKADPQPSAVERLVCDPDRRYAGRLDLRAACYGRTDEWIVDLKTNRKGRLYPSASVQVAAYHQADIICGAEPALGGLLVAVGPDGSFMEGYAPLEAWEVWDDGLRYYQTLSGMPEPLPVR